MKTPEHLPCPECGGKIFIHTDGLVGRLIAPPFFVRDKSRLEWRMVSAPFGACSSCEFTIEIQP